MLLCGSLAAIFGGPVSARVAAYRAMQRGRAALASNQFALAVAAFSEALHHRPASIEARQHLATAFVRQYVPGDETPDNLAVALAGREHFDHILRADPANAQALASLAVLYVDLQRYGAARQIYERLIGVAPSADAYARLGAIAWDEVFAEYASVRAELGLMLEQPGPLPDAARRAALRERWLQIVDDGLKHVSKAVEIDPECEDAMMTAARLLRVRADLAATPAEYARDSDTARAWTERTIGARRAKAEQQSSQGK